MIQPGLSNVDDVVRGKSRVPQDCIHMDRLSGRLSAISLHILYKSGGMSVAQLIGCQHCVVQSAIHMKIINLPDLIEHQGGRFMIFI